MRLRDHHIVASLLVGAIILGSLGVLAARAPLAEAACATGASVVMLHPGPNSTTAAPLSGIVTLRAKSTPTTATGLTFMTAGPEQKTLGGATLSGPDWVFTWDSRNLANGSYGIRAMAQYGNTTSLMCSSEAVPVTIHNTATQTPTLLATIKPGSWQGRPGNTAPFNVEAVYADQYGRKSAVTPAAFNWRTNIGRAEPNGGPSTVFTGGPNVGNGTLSVEITYANTSARAEAPIKLFADAAAAPTAAPKPAPAAATPTPAPGAGTTTVAAQVEPVSAADAQRLSTMTTIFRPANPTNSQPVVAIPTLSCFEKVVGPVRFAEISAGRSEPTAAERKQAAGCFPRSEPIPAILAPVLPAKVNGLGEAGGLVKIKSIENQLSTTPDGKTVHGLLLSGTAAPNADIYLYVFSDPLVLRAETDAKGEWSYVLDSPLPEGNHEVYAVTEKEAGSFVRTSAVPIAVAAAGPNTADGSLVVERRWTAAQTGFAAGAGLLVLAALAVLYLIRRRPHTSTHPALIMPAAPVTVATAPDPVIATASSKATSPQLPPSAASPPPSATPALPSPPALTPPPVTSAPDEASR